MRCCLRDGITRSGRVMTVCIYRFSINIYNTLEIASRLSIAVEAGFCVGARRPEYLSRVIYIRIIRREIKMCARIRAEPGSDHLWRRVRVFRSQYERKSTPRYFSVVFSAIGHLSKLVELSHEIYGILCVDNLFSAKNMLFSKFCGSRPLIHAIQM